MKIHLSETEFLKAELKRLQDDMQALAAQQAPVQEHVATLIEHYAFTDGIVRFDGVENMEQLPVGTKFYTTPPAAQRQWVGLTEDESDEIFNNWPTYNLDHFEFAQVAVAKVFEKNLTTKVTVPDALNPKDENPAYAAGWNDCRAEMLKGNTP
jgi:hypothetical protein